MTAQIGLDPASPAGDYTVADIMHNGKLAARLFCGDSYAIRPTLGWMHCDVMDPPYLIKTSGGGKFRKSRAVMEAITELEIDSDFDHAIIDPMLAGAVICFCHNDQLPKLLSRADGMFARFALCEWKKANPMPMANKAYRADREFYFHAWNKGFHPQGNLAELSRDVEAPAPRALKKRFEHPTIKPEAVMDKIMRNVAGDTVCDPFMGTGSTGVAAVQHGKTFYGIERDPRWFEAAITRITEAVEGLG